MAANGRLFLLCITKSAINQVSAKETEMPYDWNAYMDRRRERRAAIINENNYQQSLARARSGEMAQAYQEGLHAVGLDKQPRSLAQAASADQDMGANWSGGNVGSGLKMRSGAAFEPDSTITTPPTSAAAPAAPPASSASYESEPAQILHEDLEPRAAGGPVDQTKAYLVGEKGPEIFVPKEDGTIVPNNQISLEARAEGGPVEGSQPRLGRIRRLPDGSGGLRMRSGASYRQVGPTTAEAAIRGHEISKEGQLGAATIQAKSHEAIEKGRSAAQVAAAAEQSRGHVEAQRIAAEPNLITANTARTGVEREYMKQFNITRKKDYDKIAGDINNNWMKTTVPQVEAQYQATHGGQEMPPEDRARLINSNEYERFQVNKNLNTPEHQAALAMGLPKEGERAQPGLMAAQGYTPSPDGSYRKEMTHELSGSKYVDVIRPGAEGLTRSQMMAQRDITARGPGVFREGGQWYGSRGSEAMQTPPKVLTIEQALNPKFIADYNKNSERFNLPQVSPDLVKQNPEAAAWQILNGVNKINQSVGSYDSGKYLNAQTYVLNDADTQRAIAGHSNWMNPNTAAPTAPAGTPTPATTPEAIRGQQFVPGNIDLNNRPIVRNPDGSFSTVSSMSFNIDGKEVLLPTISNDGRRLTPEEAVNQYRATGEHLGKFNTPEEATAYAQQLHKDQEGLYGARMEQEEAAKDPALQNWQAVGDAVTNASKSLVNAVGPPVEKALQYGSDLVNIGAQPFKAGGEYLASKVLQGARQVIPGAYKSIQEATPENPLGIQGYQAVAPLEKTQLERDLASVPIANIDTASLPGSLARANDVISRMPGNPFRVTNNPAPAPDLVKAFNDAATPPRVQWAPSEPRNVSTQGGVNTYTPVQPAPTAAWPLRAYGSTPEAAADQVDEEKAARLQNIASPWVQ